MMSYNRLLLYDSQTTHLNTFRPTQYNILPRAAFNVQTTLQENQVITYTWITIKTAKILFPIEVNWIWHSLLDQENAELTPLLPLTGARLQKWIGLKEKGDASEHCRDTRSQNRN